MCQDCLISNYLQCCHIRPSSQLPVPSAQCPGRRAQGPWFRPARTSFDAVPTRGSKHTLGWSINVSWHGWSHGPRAIDRGPWTDAATPRVALCVRVDKLCCACVVMMRGLGRLARKPANYPPARMSKNEGQTLLRSVLEVARAVGLLLYPMGMCQCHMPAQSSLAPPEFPAAPLSLPLLARCQYVCGLASCIQPSLASQWPHDCRDPGPALFSPRWGIPHVYQTLPYLAVPVPVRHLSFSRAGTMRSLCRTRRAQPKSGASSPLASLVRPRLPAAPFARIGQGLFRLVRRPGPASAGRTTPGC